MKDNTFELPIFPLPVFLLPEGIARLRIFEPRYLKMVKIAIQGQGFVICLDPRNKEKSTKHWGSWVDVINFDQGDDGILEIDVKCKALVDIHAVDKDSDNLQFVTVCETPHWSQKVDAQENCELKESLQEALVNDAMLNELYPNKPPKNTNWVVARWLEILPVNLAIKSTFVDVHNYNEAKQFVQSIIAQDKKN
jgi:Lon protease-like protein